MEFARQYIDAFAELFKGNANSHGVHIPENKVKEGEKAEGKSFTRREAVTQDHILRHLHGEESIGISPLNSHGNIRFAVIDVDEYPIKPTKYLSILKAAGLPFVGFRSKSGGLHLYLFFAQDTDAASAVPLLNEVRQLLGLPKGTEIFPKQTRLVGEQVGNWINLPYFDYKKTKRYAYDYEGNPLNIKEALNLAEDSKVTLKTLKDALSAAPMADAPPCLQTLFVAGGAAKGARNGFLFNCATYLKAQYGKEFGEKLHALNAATNSPLKYEELDKTIIASHNKGDYSYQCTDIALSGYCDKELCKNRPFGKGAGTVSDLSFEQLIQVTGTEPYYKWIVNGVEMLFYSEAELLNQNKFRELCLRLLHKVPNQLKPNAWNKVLNRALENIVVEDSEENDDMSENALWMTKVVEFFSKRKALRPSQVEEGLVWQTDDDKLMFKGAKLLEYLDKTGLFRHFPKSQHRNLLRQLGADNAKLRYPDKDCSGRVWSLDLTVLQQNGLFLDIDKLSDEEAKESMTPLDFIGEEKF